MKTVSALLVLALSRLAGAQAGPVQSSAPAAPPPPATKLEAFRPAAGSIVTLGYDELGRVGYAISVDVRELKDAKGADVRGLVVDVTESQYREERAFVDADEIPELLKGIDALLGVQANPTAFTNFEVRYTTRGDLRLVAYNSSPTKIEYSIQAGRITAARRQVSADDMRKFRTMIEGAQQKLGSAGAK